MTEYICGIPKSVAENADYMQRTGRTTCNTSNINEKIVLPVYRYRNAYNNMSSNDPATQYYKQKIIQNTVRVKSSLYTMNLGALNVYQTPNTEYSVVYDNNNAVPRIISPGVNWNQMSDRRNPHIQPFRAGSNSSNIWRKTGPGALSPGGVGVDVKHNSYERYLNRIKGKNPIRRGKIPVGYGKDLPFNRAVPVYGGKTFKMGIVSGCKCPVEHNSDKIIMSDSGIQDEIHHVLFSNMNDPIIEPRLNALSQTTEIYNDYIGDPLPEYMHDAKDTPNVKYGHWFVGPIAI